MTGARVLKPATNLPKSVCRPALNLDETRTNLPAHFLIHRDGMSTPHCFLPKAHGAPFLLTGAITGHGLQKETPACRPHPPTFSDSAMPYGQHQTLYPGGASARDKHRHRKNRSSPLCDMRRLARQSHWEIEPGRLGAQLSGYQLHESPARLKSLGLGDAHPA